MGRRAKVSIEEIADAAIDVFTQSGYRRTKVSDVAAAAGIAPGTIYLYAESKEALFRLAVERAGGILEPPATLPIPTPPPGALTQTAKKALTRRPFVHEGEGLAELVHTLFVAMSHGRRLSWLLERSALDLPELREQYYVRGRRGLVRRLASFLDAEIAAGRMRSVPDTAVTARFVLESIAWFAMHRHGDADSASIDDAAAEEVCLDMLTHALAPRPRP